MSKEERLKLANEFMAGVIYPELQHDDPVNSLDSSTNGLINHFKKIRSF